MDNMGSNLIQDLSGRHIILGEVFCYLTHTQKLISRLVCKDWNDQLSSILANASHFSLMKESNQVLIDSNVRWTKMKVPDYESCLLPLNLKNIITSLHVDLSAHEYDFVDFMNFLIQFPKLTDLNININKNWGGYSSERTSEQVDFIVEQNVKLMTKLKNLSITFPRENFIALARFFEVCTAGTMELTKLSIREDSRPPPKVVARKSCGGQAPRPLPREPVSLIIKQVISQSAQTLKYLDLNFYSKSMQDVLFPKIISPLCVPPNPLLESLHIRSDPTTANCDRDFKIHQEFLATLFNSADSALKHVTLPWCPTAARCQEFVRTLPYDLESVENVRLDHITQEFPKNFKKLKSLSFVPGGDDDDDDDDDDENDGVGQSPSIRRIQILVKSHKDVNSQWSYSSLYRSLTTSMINLAELHIILDDISFEEHDLQDIIKEFSQLRVLRIECDGDYSRNGFTDFSVTGIAQDYMEELVKTKRFYLGKEHKIPERQMDGLPLSSLHKLETLVLPVTTVSDLGIIYGLQFGSTLQHLTFASKLNVANKRKMSEFGLHWLGAGNPALESFDGKFWSEHISTSGAEILKKQLPLLEFTGKFKLEIMKS